ncbi:MAG TPA: hypothetical protein VK797_07670 [Tepidisphaeraceae bacterium]|nr:hypothetical protein [Tepidisphaeraceae bacterium]
MSSRPTGFGTCGDGRALPKDKKEFPQIKVKNKKVKEHKGIAA